jgi:hypothetical protein
MDSLLLSSLASVLGVAGVGLGLILLLYKRILAMDVFSRLPGTRTYRLLLAMAVMVWLSAMAGLAGWLWLETTKPVLRQAETQDAQPTDRPPKDGLGWVPSSPTPSTQEAPSTEPAQDPPAVRRVVQGPVSPETTVADPGGVSSFLEATGVGFPPRDVSLSEGKYLARRGAVVDATRNIAAAIKSHLRAKTTLKGNVVVEDWSEATVDEAVAGAEVVAERFLPDGAFQVTLRVKLPSKGKA